MLQALKKIPESLRSSRIIAVPSLAARRSSLENTPVHTPRAKVPPYSAARISLGCHKVDTTEQKKSDTSQRSVGLAHAAEGQSSVRLQVSSESEILHRFNSFYSQA